MDVGQKSLTKIPLEEIASAVDALELAFALFDGDDKLRFCNAQFRLAHQGPQAALEPGLDWQIFIREARRNGSSEGFAQLDRHLSAGNEDTIRIDVARPKDRWARLRMQPLVGGAFVVTEADITESHMAAELQSEAETLLRRVLDASGALILMSSLNDRRVVYRSKAHREFMGQFETVDQLYADPNDRADFLADLLSTGILDGHEVRMIKADGSEFPARLSGRLINYEGEEVVVTSLLDMTQLHAQRDELARQREASFQNEKMTALGELLAGVAHELNNPLSVVVGQSLMLREEDLDEDLSRRVEKISASAERCAKIIKTFLAMARQKPTKLEPVDVSQIVDTALDVAGYGLRAAGATINTRFEADLPNILADEDQIAQVFINLLLNAEHELEAMGADGRIDISAVYDPDDHVVSIEFSDNGPGIPTHLRNRVFEPFFTTKTIGSGTGIGLALCHRIVGTHSGSLKLKDGNMTGACFEMRLPVSGLFGTAEPETGADMTARGFCALVVDDEQDVAEMICDMLGSIGVEGKHAGSAAAAIDMLTAGQKFDLILSDMKMPGIGGLGLLEQIHINWPQMAGRFAFVTGDAMSSDVEDIRQNLTVPLLEKPVAPAELREVVGQLVGAKSND